MNFYDKKFEIDSFRSLMNDKETETILLILNAIFRNKYFSRSDISENYVSDIEPIPLPDIPITILNYGFSLAQSYLFTICKHQSFNLIYDYKSQYNGINYEEYKSSNPKLILERVCNLIKNTISLIFPATHYPLDVGAPYDYNYTSLPLGDQSKSFLGYSEKASSIYSESYDQKLSELGLTYDKLKLRVDKALLNESLTYEKLGYKAALSDYLARNFDKALDKLFGHPKRIHKTDKFFEKNITPGFTYDSLNLPFNELETTIHNIIEYVLQYDVLSEMYVQFQYQNVYKAKYSASRPIDVANSYAQIELLKKPNIEKAALGHLLVAKTIPEKNTKAKLEKGRFKHDSMVSAISKFFKD